MTSPSKQIYLKHLVATSPLSGVANGLRTTLKTLTRSQPPELSLRRAEDTLMDNAIARLVRPTDRCLDIGAHVGLIAYNLGKIARDGQVDLIEAVPEKAEMLRRRFGADRVHEFAVADRTGTVTFYQNIKRPGFSSLSQTTDDETREITVECKRLDDVFGDDDTIDFIKIDVEGHELEALKSGTNLLTRCQPIILFEAGARHEDSGPQAEELFEWLTGDLGYSIYAAFELFHRKRGATLDEFKLYRTYPFLAFNYFAIPRDRLNDIG